MAWRGVPAKVVSSDGHGLGRVRKGHFIHFSFFGENMSDCLDVQRLGEVLIMQLNRPQARNAINLETAQALAAALETLDSDPELAARYRRFSERCLRQGQAIYRGFVEAGILAMTQAQIESLTINAWIVLTSWVRFLSTTREHSAHLGEEAFKRGVYQVLVLELGFVTDNARNAVDALCQEFHVPFNQALEH